MPFLQNEAVYTGNSYESAQGTGTLNRYFESNNYIEIINIRGDFNDDDIVYGTESGFSLRLDDFTLEKVFAADPWSGDFLVTDQGEYIAIAEHFENANNIYRQDNLITP